jgi:hypothetical protein
MPKTIALVTIHGMGDTGTDYYTEFYDEIKTALGKTTWDKVIFKPLYYQNLWHSPKPLDIFHSAV